MLLDANLLLFAVDADSPFHASSRDWLTTQLNGSRRVGIPWASLTAFLRLSTHPRAARNPLSAGEAWEHVHDWQSCDVVWNPVPTDRHADVLGSLINTYLLTGNLVPDAELAALAIEHGLVVCSTDTDFARFAEIRWLNPLAA